MDYLHVCSSCLMLWGHEKCKRSINSEGIGKRTGDTSDVCPRCLKRNPLKYETSWQKREIAVWQYQDDDNLAAYVENVKLGVYVDK